MTLADPGNAKTITADRNPCIVDIVTAAAETRTLARPTHTATFLFLSAKTIVTSCTITPTGGFDEVSGTTIVFSNSGEFAFLVSAFDGTNYYWRLIATDKTGNLSGLTATVSELNQAADESANSEIVITTNVITAAESGKTFYLALANGFTSTLPAPALGLRFRFIVTIAPTTAYIITTNGGADILFGMMEERAGTAGVAGAAQDTFNFVANNAIIADWVEFWSNGTNWYYHGMVNVAVGNTVSVT